MSIAGWFFLLVLLALYFLPSIIGFSKKKSNSGAIFALNLLLGWIFVGWVISLVWALTQDQPPQTVVVMPPIQYYQPVQPMYQQPMMPPGQPQGYPPNQGYAPNPNQGYYTQPPVTGGFPQVPPNYQGQPQQQPYGNTPNNPWN